MLKPKFELDEEIYFFVSTSKTVSKGKIVGLWVIGKENEELFNYQVEFTVREEQEVEQGKKKSKVTIKKEVDVRYLEIVPQENVTRKEAEMTKIFIPHVKKTITNKIEMLKGEIKAMDQKLEMVGEEKKEATKYIKELEDKFEEFSKESYAG